MRARWGHGATALAAGALAVTGWVSATPLSWEDLTESDWLYPVATRFARIEGHVVHYPTPTADLADLLKDREETAALRYLADARLALGDRAGAAVALESWAAAEGPEAWADTARWAARLGEMSLAFRAAATALEGASAETRSALAGERVSWADAHPEAADPLEMRAARARLLPDDEDAAEDWVRALEEAGEIDRAVDALAETTALGPDRRLLLRSDLLADHGDRTRAFDVLDLALAETTSWPPEIERAWAERADEGRPGLPESWRATLERSFDASALVRLSTYFRGRDRGAAAVELLRQVELRYEDSLTPAEWRLVARLYAAVDAVPEAFRAHLAAAGRAEVSSRADDLAALARCALDAGARPLAWGRYNDAPYRWIGRVDRTPGFWTGGVAFLLTGTDWPAALERLEVDSLADRTFATALALVANLADRDPGHPELPSLRAAVMARHVQRGEGEAALELLPLVEAGGSPGAVAEARLQALLAFRQVERPLDEESRLWRERLRGLAPDGSRPSIEAQPRWWGGWSGGETKGSAWTRRWPAPPEDGYRNVLEEALARLDERDPSHGAALGLILGEMDRLPEAEDLWVLLADRLESWNLDDDLGPRFERALAQFPGPSWWARAARWYARRARSAELRRLTDELVARFRSAGILERAPVDQNVRLEIPDQPRTGERVRLVVWADWVRLEALRRFPQSPAIYEEARRRLIARSLWTRHPGQYDGTGDEVARTIVADALLEDRGWAVLFADAARREELFRRGMRTGALPAWLAQWEESPDRTPVHDLLLFEGHARLSQFEDAVEPAARLAAAYPGDGNLAGRTLSLYRSLSPLDPAQSAAAAALVETTAPALVDPSSLWTTLGELEWELGRPDRANEAWRHLLDGGRRDPARVEQLATLLWDYGEMGEALAIVEDARRRLARPALLAFEAGVLREEEKDVEGAIREYLTASEPTRDGCFCSGWETDQRALRRLSQLLARERVRVQVESRVAALRPGRERDEAELVALFPLATITMPDAGLDWTVDDWIDAEDHPVDPVARETRRRARPDWRLEARRGQERVAAALLEQAREMVPAATGTGFLDAVARWSGPLVESQTTREAQVDLHLASLARRAALAETPEERVSREIDYALALTANGRHGEADALWAELEDRIGVLPEGAPRMGAETARAAHIEDSRGTEAAALEWERLSERYPWSLAILDQRVAFLRRVDRKADARGLLEAAVPAAARGHREAFLGRLTREAMADGDLAQAERAVAALLADPNLDPSGRLEAVQLAGRLALRRNAEADLVALARNETKTLPAADHAAVYAGLARGAALEASWSAALDLWIEALNRQMEGDWLRAACQAAERAERQESLLGFFETQHARSPRDVRWAVAVRDIRLYFGDTAGAVAMARVAIDVRPERESLWIEGADLLARLGRPREAADLLAGWARPRPADETVAARRSELLAAAGDGDAALAVETKALEAFASAATPLSDESRERLADRWGRAARRLYDLGLPAQAMTLLAPDGDLRLAGAAGLDDWSQAEIALAAGGILPLLQGREEDDDFRNAAGYLLSDRGRPEDREAVLEWIVDEVRPAGADSPDQAAFARWWPFASRAGLDGALRVALARRHTHQAPGPWSATPPEAFLDAVGQSIVGNRRAADGRNAPAVVAPSLDALWVQDLVRRDDAEALWLFLEPRWNGLREAVHGPAPVGRNAKRVEWTVWLDDPNTLALWAEGASRRTDGVDGIASILSERRAWDRLWALGARHWRVGPLVNVLPDEARRAWFRFWETPSPLSSDPVERARGETVENAGVTVGGLVAGAEDAATWPLVPRLRGPETVGGVLGDSSRWVFPEFAPRPGDAGEALVVGRGVDEGRLPGALWGDRPGTAWFAFETLVRLREEDPTATLVPLEVLERGGERARSRLAARLAEAAGNPDQALRIAEALASPTAADLRRHLSLLQECGRGDEAAQVFATEVRGRQKQMDEATLRELWRTSQDLGLTDPVELLDPAVPLPGAFLAALCDRRGLEACRAFHPQDPVDFRAALSRRWSTRWETLTADEVRFALRELWAHEAAWLPDDVLDGLGFPWADAGPWLRSLRPGEREAALAALDALPDDSALRVMMKGPSDVTPSAPSEAAGRLLLAVLLARAEDDAAREEFEDQLAGLVKGTLAVSALDAWLAPFREAGRLDLVRDSALAALDNHLESRPGAVDAWVLAVRTAAGTTAAASTFAKAERAWRVGDLDADALGPLVEAMGLADATSADRWLARWPTRPGLSPAVERAEVLSRLGRRDAAAAVVVEARARVAWSVADDVRAFDLWRDLAAPTASDPERWRTARAFWSTEAGGLDLAGHLRAHPFDALAARAALADLGPEAPDAAAVARRTLRLTGSGEPGGGPEVLGLREARALFPTSARAAHTALGGFSEVSETGPEGAPRPPAQVREALADVARIGAAAADEGLSEAALVAFEDRAPRESRDLRRELERLDAPEPPRSWQMRDAGPRPWRPRDLDWSVVSSVLDAEGWR